MEFIDQLNRRVILPKYPERIISLVPSQTELLFDLGLGDKVVGITKFCIHPNEWHKTKDRVGGTKTIDFEKIALLKPDLIIANKEENEEAQINELMKTYPVWISDIITLPDAYAMIKSVGCFTATEDKAIQIADEIALRFNQLEKSKIEKKVLYFIWENPYLVAGKNTFIDTVLAQCGFVNAVNDSRYPNITTEDIKQINPDIILLSSEPFPFKVKHITQLRAMCPHAIIELVDGELFSWYGSRLLKTPNYLQQLINKVS